MTNGRSERQRHLHRSDVPQGIISVINNKLPLLVLVLTACTLHCDRGRAERIPDVPEDATHIITGVVDRVFQRESKEQDQYVIQIRVESVERGKGVKDADVLLVYCFQRKASASSIPAESGHKAIPKEGPRIRALAKPRHGVLAGLYPDWFQPISGESATAMVDFATLKDATLLRTEKAKGVETFFMNTQLNSGAFAGELKALLGSGWKKRVLQKEDMQLAAAKGRSLPATVNLTAYSNAKIPGVDIRAFHLKYKTDQKAPNVEIAVVRNGSKE